MRSFEIENVKKFTAALFASELFDSFCVTEASFSTLITVSIDGHINQDFGAAAAGNAAMSESEKNAAMAESDVTVPAEHAMPAMDQPAQEPVSAQTSTEVARWQQIRPLCYEAIKGDKPPLRFKIVFMTPPEKVPGFIEKHGLNINPAFITGLFMNIRFEKGKLSCISGTSVKTFTMDKSLENAWDESVAAFIKKFN